MTVRHKNWTAGDQLKASDMNDLANNGAVQVDTIAELTDVFDNQTNVNVVFCLEDMLLYTRGGAEFAPVSFGVPSATFDESASTGATFYTMVDPDGSGNTYRVAEFLDHGTLVFSSGGTFDSWMGASGNSGGSSGASAIFGSGGNYGGIQELFNVVAEEGTFDVHVGSVYGQAYKSDSSRITGPFQGFKQIVCGTHQWTQGSTYAYRGYSESIHQVDWDSPPIAYYGLGTAGGGAQAGRPGYGGNGSGGSGGPAGEVSGWTDTPFMWGRGGGGSYTLTPEPANTGNGGHGSQNSSYAEGGSGRVYIRVKA